MLLPLTALPVLESLIFPELSTILVLDLVEPLLSTAELLAVELLEVPALLLLLTLDERVPLERAIVDLLLPPAL